MLSLTLQNEDVHMFSWRGHKVGSKDIIPRARKQKTRDTYYAYATSAYMQILYRFIQAKNKIGCEYLLEDISAEQIIDIKKVVGTGKLQRIFEHIIESRFVPLTDKEYANGKQRTFCEGDPRRAFDVSHSIYQKRQPDGEWRIQKICKEISLHGAVIGVFPSK
ncbi:hypothetical protein Tsubulata_045429 [Turnera subulata]|uniref:Uncharacterized protein n=1 Tax=Turnera subulata TaxID=218843 RepID=A0A9Q0F0I5_9ROSI|nr:hypothetical protein Tsubulata_045429 [Turnera subulata]